MALFFAIKLAVMTALNEKITTFVVIVIRIGYYGMGSIKLEQNMGESSLLGFRCAPMERVRIGFIGVGVRGLRAVKRMLHIEGVDVVAVCDFVESNIEASLALIDEYNRKKPSIYLGASGWRTLCESDNIDLVYIGTDWLSHADIAVYAMECGNHAAIEVPAAMTIADCWRLVDTAERCRRHCMMLENCCYDEFELTTLNMAQQGLFGDIIHAEASYIHDLRKRISSNDEGNRRWINWQVEYMATHIANFYPTHGLGPVALALGIHRGDRMKSLVSVSSRGVGRADEFRGTMNSSIITTERGRTILLQHCIALPRPYSRSFMLSGTQGYVQKYPAPHMVFAPDTDKVLSGEECAALTLQYRHPFIEEYKAKGIEVCGARWIDYLMDSRLIYCLRNGLPLDMDIYDAVEWSSLVELTEQSAMAGGEPVDIPDFTRGAWERCLGFDFAVL